MSSVDVIYLFISMIFVILSTAFIHLSTAFIFRSPICQDLDITYTGWAPSLVYYGYTGNPGKNFFSFR